MSEELIDLYLSDLLVSSASCHVQHSLPPADQHRLRTQSVTEDLTKADSPARGLATLGRGKYNQSAELKAGSSGHEEGDAHKPTTYARQC